MSKSQMFFFARYGVTLEYKAPLTSESNMIKIPLENVNACKTSTNKCRGTTLLGCLSLDETLF